MSPWIWLKHKRIFFSEAMNHRLHSIKQRKFIALRKQHIFFFSVKDTIYINVKNLFCIPSTKHQYHSITNQGFHIYFASYLLQFISVGTVGHYPTKLATLLHQVHKIRIHESVCPILYAFTAWCLVTFKDSCAFTTWFCSALHFTCCDESCCTLHVILDITFLHSELVMREWPCSGHAEFLYTSKLYYCYNNNNNCRRVKFLLGQFLVQWLHNVNGI